MAPEINRDNDENREVGLPKDSPFSSFSTQDETQFPDSETEAEVFSQAFLSELISEETFLTDEANLHGDEKDQGVTRHETISGDHELLFDRESVSIREQALIEKFISLYENQGRDGLRGTRYEWFFSEPDEQGHDQLLPDSFFQELVAQLKIRLEEIKQGKQYSSLGNMEFDDLVGSAPESFRKMAQREKLAETFKEHIQKIPIKEIIGRKSDGSQVTLNFDPLNPDKSDVDFVFVNSASGGPELIITNSNPEITAIKPVYKDTSEITDGKNFSIADYKREEITHPDTDGKITSHVISVEKGDASVIPLFSKIRVLSAPVNMDEELDKLLDERNKKAEEKKKKERHAPASYAPPPPSVPSQASTPRYSQPTTYVRSG